jgi:hypothetical protein
MHEQPINAEEVAAEWNNFQYPVNRDIQCNQSRKKGTAPGKKKDSLHVDVVEQQEQGRKEGRASIESDEINTAPIRPNRLCSNLRKNHPFMNKQQSNRSREGKEKNSQKIRNEEERANNESDQIVVQIKVSPSPTSLSLTNPTKSTSYNHGNRICHE